MSTLEHLATVLAWDDETGTGRFADDLFCREQAFDRSVLRGATRLEVGQRVVYGEDYQPSPDGGSPWTTAEVRPISSDAAYWAEALEQLCRAVDRAATDLRVAEELAPEDTVESMRETLVAATERRDTKVPEIADGIVARCTSTGMATLPGFDRTIYAQGEEPALRAVLDQIGTSHHEDVLWRWTPMLRTLEEIRAADYLPAEGEGG